ncbi:MAG: dihydrofolate reductase family protein [Chitinispirillaceae bacterium]|jgi:dihydrofolate reductase
MRKIIVFDMITADGFFAGGSGEIDWHVVDSEFNEYAIEMLNAADTLFFGRITYDVMAGYWPTPTAIKNDPLVAERMNNLQKIVFSKTLKILAWNNSQLMADIVREEILAMKQRPGRDMLILGSGVLVSAFARLGLIDEYRLMVNPVVLCHGKTLFEDAGGRIKLRLLKTKTLRSGNILMYYEPE